MNDLGKAAAPLWRRLPGAVLLAAPVAAVVALGPWPVPAPAEQPAVIAPADTGASGRIDVLEPVARPATPAAVNPDGRADAVRELKDWTPTGGGGGHGHPSPHG
jgi:hypothetical protein